nr:MAG TPA: terminase large subunit [Caudoviricetes sp.]
MTKSQIDPETGDELPPFGVAGGTFEEVHEQYKKIKGDNVERDAMYLIKANAPINTEAHVYAKTQLDHGKIRFLIDEREASAKLMSTKVGQTMTPDERAEFLVPFVRTTVLKEQMCNLVQSNEGVNIMLKCSSSGIKKDKFSAFEYGLYFIKQEEDRTKKRKSHSISDFMFFS